MTDHPAIPVTVRPACHTEKASGPTRRLTILLALAASLVALSTFAASFALLALAIDLRTAMVGATVGMTGTLVIAPAWVVVARRVATRMLIDDQT